MSETVLEQHHPPQEGFPTKAHSLSLTEYHSGRAGKGLQLTLSGNTMDFHQYVLLDEESAREVQDQIDATFGGKVK